jgi:hypothetical protein
MQNWKRDENLDYCTEEFNYSIRKSHRDVSIDGKSSRNHNSRRAE